MSSTPLLLSPSMKRVLAVITAQTLRHGNGTLIALASFTPASPKITEAELASTAGAIAQRTFTDLDGEYRPIVESWKMEGGKLCCTLSSYYVAYLGQVGCLPVGWLNGPILPKPAGNEVCRG